MAIVYCRPTSGRGAEIGQPTDKRLRRGWLLKTDTRYQSEASVLQEAVLAGYLPIPYVDRHEDDYQYLCKRLRGKQETNSPLHWRIEAEFDTAPTNSDDEPESPLNRPAKITWSTTKYQKAIERDRNGEAILNSAGDYFDPPPVRDISRWVVTVSKNVAAVPTQVLTYVDRINDAAWTIDGVTVAQYAAKVASISIGEEQGEAGVIFRVFGYSAEIDSVDLWKGKYLNQGFYYKDGSDRKRILDANSKPVASPKLLNSSGAVITDPTPASASFKEYDVCETLDYSVFPVA